MESIEKALQLTPDQAAAHCTRGEIFKEMGNYSYALIEFRKVFPNARNLPFLTQYVKDLIEEVIELMKRNAPSNGGGGTHF
jgi:regulator of sirC expression with transglutaminase-like and TPR domain